MKKVLISLVLAVSVTFANASGHGVHGGHARLEVHEAKVGNIPFIPGGQ